MNSDLVKWIVFITAKQQQKAKPQSISRAANYISAASYHEMESVCMLQVQWTVETQFGKVWRQNFVWFFLLESTVLLNLIIVKADGFFYDPE